MRDVVIQVDRSELLSQRSIPSNSIRVKFCWKQTNQGGGTEQDGPTNSQCVTVSHEDTATVRALGWSGGRLYRHCRHLVSNDRDSRCYALSRVLVL